MTVDWWLKQLEGLGIVSLHSTLRSQVAPQRGAGVCVCVCVYIYIYTYTIFIYIYIYTKQLTSWENKQQQEQNIYIYIYIYSWEVVDAGGPHPYEPRFVASHEPYGPVLRICTALYPRFNKYATVYNEWNRNRTYIHIYIYIYTQTVLALEGFSLGL